LTSQIGTYGVCVCVCVCVSECVCVCVSFVAHVRAQAAGTHIVAQREGLVTGRHKLLHAAAGAHSCAEREGMEIVLHVLLHDGDARVEDNHDDHYDGFNPLLDDDREHGNSGEDSREHVEEVACHDGQKRPSLRACVRACVRGGGGGWWR
jgi:hypothetical protein